MHDKASKKSILGVFSEWRLYIGMTIVRTRVDERPMAMCMRLQIVKTCRTLNLIYLLTAHVVVGKRNSRLRFLIHSPSYHRRSGIHVGRRPASDRPSLYRRCYQRHCLIVACRPQAGTLEVHRLPIPCGGCWTCGLGCNSASKVSVMLLFVDWHQY